MRHRQTPNTEPWHLDGLVWFLKMAVVGRRIEWTGVSDVTSALHAFPARIGVSEAFRGLERMREMGWIEGDIDRGWAITPLGCEVVRLRKRQDYAAVARSPRKEQTDAKL